MADATGYDPKNISGLTTLYVVPTAATNPIYRHPYTTGEIAAFDNIVAGSGYTAGTATLTGGTGAEATATITVNGSGEIQTVVPKNKGRNYDDDEVLTIVGGNGAGRATVNGVSDGQTDTELSPHQDVCAAGTLSTSSW
tara:strand:+ start:37 stop:453 length:417 start_codon:yes stop_codon:yes gene_type:complete